MLRRVFRLSLLTLALFAIACGAPTPAPAFPSAVDPDPAEGDLAEVLGLNEDEEEPEDDDWVDPGPGDESMDGADESASDAADAG